MTAHRSFVLCGWTMAKRLTRVGGNHPGFRPSATGHAWALARAHVECSRTRVDRPEPADRPHRRRVEREEVAGSTGLEPAASGVTGRRSNQLNYDPAKTGDCNLIGANRSS